MTAIVAGGSAIWIERNVRVPMPDGATLAVDIIRPQTSESVPALLVRTPYGRGPVPATAPADALSLVEAGYAVVSQDTRGRFDSDGEFHPFRDEPGDGSATISWLIGQPWSDGKVGMLGGSYVGATQWLAAGTSPPGLGAFVPYLTAADYHEGWTYQGGAFQLGFALRWALSSLSLAAREGRPDADPAVIEELTQAFNGIAAGYLRRPLRDQPVLDRVAPFYREWLAHPTRDDWWRTVAPSERYGAVLAPALNVGGWYDIFVAGTVANYQGLRTRGGSEAARTGTRLIVGPWSHTSTERNYPERMYGWGAELDHLGPTNLHLRFFDRWLRGIDNGLDTEPSVRLFVMGIDRWQDESDWPLPDAEERPMYLRAGGSLAAAPSDDEHSDTYRSDPADPMPSHGGATLMPGGRAGWNDGPWDQRALDHRTDVLRYLSPILELPLSVIGDVNVVLFASSSARDTDFVARLIDVHPDGRAELLTEGILRARYRDGLDRVALLETGRATELRVSLGPTANVFLPGHRVRLDIASSSFPRFDPNPQTGGDFAAETERAFVVATNRIFHDRLHPSRLILPVVERDWGHP